MSVAPSTARRLLARLAEAQRGGRLPCVVAALLRDGDVVWEGSYGEVGLPGTRPGDVQFRIGSITKTFTAVVVLQLVRDGRLRLDDPVGDVLGDVGYARRTVASLLAHDGGLTAEPAGAWWEAAPGQSWDDLAAGLTGEQVFDPGRRFHYSNLGYALLGEVAARVGGAPWWDLVTDRVVGPLGLLRTTYLPESPAAQGYAVDPYARTLVEQPATDTGAMAPAGQLWSTTEDLLRWARFLLDGHPEVLSAADLREAAHPRSGDQADGLDSAQGLGFMLVGGGSGMLVGHTGSMPGFRAGCYVDRPRRTAAVLLANATHGPSTSGLCRDLLELLEECEPTLPAPWVPAESVPEQYAELLGLWHWGRTPMVFSHEDGALVVRVNGAVEDVFEVRDDRIVGVLGYHAGEPVEVVRTADGSVDHLELSTFVLTRQPR